MALLTGKRELLARALGHRFLRPLGRAIAAPGLIALTYHRVSDYVTLDDGVVSASVEEFEWQLEFVKTNIRVLSGEEILRHVAGDLHLTEPALCITFDDGYTDNLEAGRALHRHGLPAIFFVTSGFIGTDNITQWDRLAYATKFTEVDTLHMAALGKRGPWKIPITPRDLAMRELKNIYFELPPADQNAFVESVELAAKVAAKDEARTSFMRWEDVRSLRSLGHMIGAHTHTHPILSKISVEEQTRELTICRDLIAAEIGEAPKILAYPNGKAWTFSSQTKDVARQCGFLAAFSFYGGRNPPVGFDAYDLRRGWVSRSESRELFRARISFPQFLA